MLRLYPMLQESFLKSYPMKFVKRGYLCSLPTNLFGRISEAILRLYQQHEDGIKTLSVQGWLRRYQEQPQKQ
jgi:hypothetical protein